MKPKVALNPPVRVDGMLESHVTPNGLTTARTRAFYISSNLYCSVVLAVTVQPGRSYIAFIGRVPSLLCVILGHLSLSYFLYFKQLPIFNISISFHLIIKFSPK